MFGIGWMSGKGFVFVVGCVVSCEFGSRFAVA